MTVICKQADCYSLSESDKNKIHSKDDVGLKPKFSSLKIHDGEALLKLPRSLSII